MPRRRARQRRLYSESVNLLIQRPADQGTEIVKIPFGDLIKDLAGRDYVFVRLHLRFGSPEKFDKINVTTEFQGIRNPYTKPWKTYLPTATRPLTWTATPRFPNERNPVQPSSDFLVIEFESLEQTSHKNPEVFITTTVQTFMDAEPREITAAPV